MKIKNTLLAAGLFFGIHASAQTKDTTEAAKPPVIYHYVEQMPSSGYDYKKYLAENVHYPDSARVHNIEGRVIVKFIVTETGSVDSAIVMRGIGGGCDEEALRVVQGMPAWRPGKQNGIPVRVYFTLPIVFKLTD